MGQFGALSLVPKIKTKRSETFSKFLVFLESGLASKTPNADSGLDQWLALASLARDSIEKVSE
jgi:hypothetical protein